VQRTARYSRPAIFEDQLVELARFMENLMFDPTGRRPRLGLRHGLAALLAIVGLAGGAAQQPPNQQRPTGLPPGTPTQPSPSGLLIPVQPPAAPPPAVLQSYQPVTDDRLLHPEDRDWLMVRRSYDGWGYSPLSQITPANVKRLQPVWLLSTGMNNGHQAPPIVNNGVMFVATSYNQVIALNAKTGQELWRYRSPSPPARALPRPTSNGSSVSPPQLSL